MLMGSTVELVENDQESDLEVGQLNENAKTKTSIPSTEKES